MSSAAQLADRKVLDLPRVLLGTRPDNGYDMAKS